MKRRFSTVALCSLVLGSFCVWRAHAAPAEIPKEPDVLRATLTNGLQVIVVHNPLAPVVTTVPLQVLACEIADSRGLDVDQPRNLAKSVTVE